MKTILAILIMAGAAMTASAEPGFNMYEVADSSITSDTILLSSHVPTLITRTPAVSGTIGWYSTTLYNVTASSDVYAWSGSATVAPVPALTCTSANAVTLAAGIIREEKFNSKKFFLWGLSCASGATQNIRAVFKGR